MRSFGPSVYQEKDGSFRASCTSCMFLLTYGKSMCRHREPLRHVPDPANTPEWCEMRDDMLRDAADMHNGVELKRGAVYVVNGFGREVARFSKEDAP